MWSKLIKKGFTRQNQVLNSVKRLYCRKIDLNGPDLRSFLVAGKTLPKPVRSSEASYLNSQDFHGNARKVHLEIYGCQMNVNDSEIVWAILQKNGYTKATDLNSADVALLVTCAIREGAEKKIWNRLNHLSAMKAKRSKKRGPFQIGILGCMAERLKTQVLEVQRSVDVVAGPDAYKDLPRLLALTRDGENSAVNVLLSLEETYADVMPVRIDENSVTAYVSIMRGCDNLCSYCIVPHTRGRERSRALHSIEHEVEHLADQGIKEITLLGQNVNSYRDLSDVGDDKLPRPLAPGFKTVYKTKEGGVRFAELLARMAEAVPDIRIRFTSPHPKDFPLEVLNTIKYYPNLCNSLHIPAQSGSSTVLERMRRGYTREAYIDLIHHVRDILPNVTLSSDFICGFCGETDEEFEETLSLINTIKYNNAFLFAYSMREKTTAHRRYADNVSAAVKNQRLIRMVAAFRRGAEELNKQMIGRTELILVEGKSKRSDRSWYGRTDGNIKVIIPMQSVLDITPGYHRTEREIQVGDFVQVQIENANSQTLVGKPIEITTIRDFYGQQYNQHYQPIAVTI